MQENTSSDSPAKAETAAVVEVYRKDLPVHCPPDESKLWSSHPRVYIPLKETRQAACSYCGTVFKLLD